MKANPREAGAMRVLVVEDSPLEALLLCAMITAMGHEARLVASGEAALEAYPGYKPDLVLLDLMLPGIGGGETAAALRRLDPVRWAPIWFVTASTENADIAEALAAGGEALIRKPVNPALFRAQFMGVARQVALQRQLIAQNEKLQSYFEVSEEENREACDIMNRLLQIQGDRGAALRVWNAPAFKFSGDIVMAERSPDGSLKVLLADGVGHGLSAALNVLPLGRAFQAMAQKGFGLPALVTELNYTIRRDLPSHRFVATTLVNIDAIEDRIEVWNGGNPACLMVDTAGAVIWRGNSHHLPLGVVANDEIDPRAECLRFRSDVQLILCSDGVVEAGNDHGAPFGESGLVNAIRGVPPGQRFERVKRALADHLGGASAADDVTLAVLDCGEEAKRREVRGNAVTVPHSILESKPTGPSGDWDLHLRIGAERLKQVDMVPILQSFLSRFDPIGALDQSTFVVLAELFNNALDHGLLEMDSRVKREHNGPQAYARERERRLAALRDGVIIVDLARRETVDGAKLRVRVKDSGKGFDLAAWNDDADALFRRTDRGIGLLEKLCESVQYGEGGTEIVVTRALPRMLAAH